jgi:hypothetical protein
MESRSPYFNAELKINHMKTDSLLQTGSISWVANASLRSA